MNIIQSILSHKRGLIPLAAFFVFCGLPVSAADLQNLKQVTELKNRNVSPPDIFKKEYKLDNLPQNAVSSGSNSAVKIRALKKASGNKTIQVYAEVAVNILGPNFKPVKAYVLRNVTDPDNAATLWDGRDSYGRELPKGEYYAQLSILYSDGKQETKTFRFEKK